MTVGTALLILGLGTSLPVDVANQVEVALTTDRLTYHVGQSVRLTASVRNNGDRPLFGYLWLQPYLPEGLRTSALLYCRNGGGCVEFLGRIPNIDFIETTVAARRLASMQEERSTFVVAFNPQVGRLVFDEPGDYEFRWVTWGIHARDGVGTRARGAELSASAHVSVLPVPSSEAAAFTVYFDGALAELAQYNPSYVVVRPEHVRAARTLLERYPDSIYAAAIRPALTEVLRQRVTGNRASREERELLEDLRRWQTGLDIHP